MIWRIAASLGRLLLGVVQVLATLAVILFAVAVYLLSLPYRRQHPRQATIKAGIDAAAAVGVLVQLAGQAKAQADAAAADAAPTSP